MKEINVAVIVGVLAVKFVRDILLSRLNETARVASLICGSCVCYLGALLRHCFAVLTLASILGLLLMSCSHNLTLSFYCFYSLTGGLCIQIC